MTVCIFLPVSRPDYLSQLFRSLELLDCDEEQIILLAYVDGDNRLYQATKSMVDNTKFAGRQTIQRPLERRKEQPTAPHGIHERRKRIAAIKNESRALIPDCQYVFGIEDDTLVPPHALMQLLDDHAGYPHAGYVQGVELGRWQLPYVGAWRADDPFEPTSLQTIMPGEGLEPVDAGGFYCYLTRRELYVAHEYKTFGYNELGPDVQYGLYLRQNGYQNFVDWRVSCKHIARGGEPISLSKVDPIAVSVVKDKEGWHQKLAR